MFLGEISIDITFNESSIDRSIEKLRNKIKSIDEFNIKVGTDETKLVGLNNHLDKKQRHLRETVQYYKNNPIKVHYIEEKEVRTKTSTSSGGQSTNSGNASNNDFVDASKDIKEILRSINEFKSLFRQSTSFNPLKEISKGLFQSIGETVVKPLTKGFVQELEQKNNISVKDFGKMGAQWVQKQWSTEPSKSTQTQPSTSKVYNQPGRATSPQLTSANFLNNNSITGQNQKVAEYVTVTQALDKNVNQAIKKRFSTIVGTAITNINAQITNEKTTGTGDLDTAKKEFDRIKNGFKTAYAAYQKNLKQGNIEVARAYYNTILEMGERAFKDIDKIKEDLKSSGTKSNFGSQLTTQVGSIKGTLKSVYINRTKRSGRDLEETAMYQGVATDTGKQVIAGIAQGLKAGSGAQKEAAIVALSILSEFRRVLGIQSPSKRGWEIGGFVVQGVIQGIKSASKGLRNAVGDVIDDAIPSVDRVKERARNKAKGIFPNLIPNTPAERATEKYRLQNTLVDPLGMDAIKNQIRNPQPYGSNNWKPGMKLPDDAGSVNFFERLFTLVGNKAIGLAEKTYGKKEGAQIAKQAGAAAAFTVYPTVAAGALASPLALPLLPTIMAYKEAVKILTPLVTKLNEAIEQVIPIQLKLNNLAGSVVGGEKELGYVQGVSKKFGTNIQGSANAFADISFATKGTRLEGEETRDIFEGIASATKFVGANAASASLIFNSFNQMIAKGKVSMEELRLQLSERFPPAMNVFAKALGVSVPELTELISKGAVLAEDVLPRVADVLLRDFSKSTKSAASDFVLATTRMENAGFEFSKKLVDSYVGIETTILNLGASVAEKFLGNFDFITKGFNVLAITLTATAAAGFQTILNTRQLAEKLNIVQNLFTATFRKTLSMITPFAAGIMVDLLDDIFGAKNSVFDNMSKGISNAFTGAFAELDALSRNFFQKGLFNVDIDVKSIGMFEQLTNTLGGLFKIIPSGVVETGALVLMFQQVALLGKTYLVPSLASVGSALRSMVGGVKDAVFNLGNIRDTISEIFPAIMHGAKNVAGALSGLALNVGAALAVMAFTQSDFGDPLAGGINEAKKRINADLDGIDFSLKKLKTTGADVGKSISKSLGDALELKSKGLELNFIPRLLGLSEESYKSDDLFKAINNGGGGIFASGELTDPERKYAQETKSKAQTFGVGDFFSGQEKNLTLAQKQLLGKAEDLSKLNTQLGQALGKRNLSPGTMENFVSGDVKKAIDDVRAIDKEIEALGKKRSSLSLVNSSDAKKEVRIIDKEIRTLTDTRKAKVKPLSEQLGFVDDIKETLESINTQIDNDASLPKAAKNALKNIIEPQKKAINETVNYLKNQGVYKIAQPLEEIWTGIISKLRDADMLFEKLSSRQKIENFQSQTQILTSGGTEGNTKDLMERLSIADMEQQRQAQQAVLAIRQKSLARLLTIPEVESTETRKKEIEDLRKNVSTDSLNLAETQQKIAQAQTSLATRIREQAKAVRDYYETIAQQAYEQQLEYKKLQNQIKTNNQQSKIRNILADGFDTAISQFLDSISAIISKEAESANRQLDVQSQINQVRIGERNQLRSGDELARSLPGVPINTEIVITNQGTLDNLVNQLQGSVSTSNTLNNGIQTTTNSVSQLYQELLKVNYALTDNNQKTVQGSNNIDQWNNKIKTTPSAVNDVTESFNNASKSSMSFADTIFNALKGYASALKNMITDFVKSLIENSEGMLASFTERIQKAVGSMDGQGNGGVLGAVANAGVEVGQKIGSKIVSFFQGGGTTQTTGAYRPLDSTTGQHIKNFEQVSIHHPKARGALGIEAGREYSRLDGKLEEVTRSKAGELIKKDMVLYQGNNKNVPVPSPATGIVKSTGLGVGAVTIANEAGDLVAKVLHLANIKVKPGDRVSYGQPLGIQSGAGTKKGVFSLSTYPIHFHGEMTTQMWKKYIEDLNDGIFDATKQGIASSQTKNQSIVQYSKKAQEEPHSKITSSIKAPGVVARFSGKASFYSNSSNTPDGLTANGERFDDRQMTAASNTLPMGSLVRVRNVQTGESIIVRINDTGGFTKLGRVIDLSKGAARAIGITEKQGLGNVVGEVLAGKAPKGKAGDALVAQLNASKVPTTPINNTDPTSPNQKNRVLYNTPKNAPINSGGNNFLQAKVADANDMARQNAALNEKRIREQEALNKQREAEESKREINRAINTLDKYARDLNVNFKQTKKTSNDADFNAIPFATPEQKYQKDRNDIQSEFGDRRTQIQETLTTISPAITQAREALKQLNLDPKVRATLVRTLGELTDKETKYQSVLRKTDSQEKIALNTLDIRYRHEIEQRSKRENLENKSSALENLKAEVEYVETLSSIRPYDRSTKELPSLKAKISLLENEINYEQKLNELEARRTENQISPETYQAQLSFLKGINEARISGIQLIQTQQERELKIQENRDKFEQKSKIQSLQNQIDKNKIFSPDTVYKTELQSIGQQRDSSVFELKPTVDPLDMFRERQKLGQIYQQDAANAELNRNNSRIENEQSMYDLFAKPGINKRNAKTDQMSANRANEFSINALKRETGVLEENFRYRQELMEIEAKIAEYRLKGANIDETQVTQLREDLAAINEYNLESINNQFKTFGRTIDDVTKESFGNLGSQISDLILQGGSLGDIFQNTFNSIANSFISTGLNNLIGGGLDTLFGRKKEKSSEDSGVLGGLFEAIGGGSGTGLLGGISKIFGFRTGGMVTPDSQSNSLRFMDNSIGAALRQEGSDSVLATLTPNERVLTRAETVLYNTLFPAGIRDSLRPMQFNDGGMVPTSINGGALAAAVGATSNLNVAVNASVGENSSSNLTEAQLVNRIRAVVIAELKRQKSPGGIL